MKDASTLQAKFARFRFFRPAAICCFCFILPFPVEAQQNIYQALSVSNGLPSNYITVMHFDRDGYFWISTDKGLCRYNGQQMDLLTIDDGLATNINHHIVEDEEKNLWIFSNLGTASRIKKTPDRIWVDTSFNLCAEGFNLKDILLDDNGRWWLQMQNVPEKTSSWFQTDHLFNPGKKVASYSGFQSQVYPDITGQLWYNKAARITWSVVAEKSAAVGISMGVDDSVTLKGVGNKIIVFGRNNCPVYYGSNPESAYTLQLPEGFKKSTGLRYVSIGSRDVIYRGENGFLIYENGKFVKWVKPPKKEEAYIIFEISPDRFGNLFCSNFGEGIFIYRNEYLQLFETGEITQRIALGKEAVYFNSKKALYTLNKKIPQEVKEDIFPSLITLNFCAIGTGGQVLVSNHNIIREPEKPGQDISGDSINDLGDVAPYGKDLYLISYSTGMHKKTATGWDEAWRNQIDIKSNLAERIKIYGDNLYVTTLKSGIRIIDLSTGKKDSLRKKEGLLSNTVFDVLPEDSMLWIGTNGGVSKWQNETLISYGRNKGFTGSRCISIFRDLQKRLWVLSDSSLHIFNNNRLYAIRSHPVLVNNSWYLTTAKYDADYNRLWVGCSHGILSISMDAVVPNYQTYSFEVVRAMSGNQIIPIQKNSISIDWDHEPLRFQVSNRQFSLVNQPLVYIRLKGFESNWNLLSPDGRVSYGRLPQGKYVLEYHSIGPDFGEIAPSTLLTIQVNQPWWRQPWFFLLLLGAATALAFLISGLKYRKSFQRKLNQQKAYNTLQEERGRISRELHDNVGSMLTLMINQMEDSEPISNLPPEKNPTGIARKTLSQLRDAIWALDHKQLTTQEWKNRTGEYLQTLKIQDYQVYETYDWPPDIKLSPVGALHTFRIVQEACNNIIKHSGSREIYLHAYGNQTQLQIEISDKGKGFDPLLQKKGYGLKNMKKRIQEMHGTVEIISEKGQGTRIKISWPVTEK